VRVKQPKLSETGKKQHNSSKLVSFQAATEDPLKTQKFKIIFIPEEMNNGD